MQIEANNIKANKKDIVYPELSYQLMGILFKVHNKLGPNYQEKYYQRAIAEELNSQGFKYKREKMVPVRYANKNIDRYFLDFVIEDKIVLEVKVGEFFKRKYLTQVLDYLSATNLKLAILVSFRGEKLFYKRIINPHIQNQ